MTKQQLARIAYVKLSSQGSSYPMACPRLDINPGDQVYVQDPNGPYQTGIVTSITQQRWRCRWQVLALLSEGPLAELPEF